MRRSNVATRRHRWQGLIGVFTVVAAVVIAFPGPAAAHAGEETYLYVEIDDDGVEGSVQYPVADLGAVLGIEIPQDESGLRAAVEANYESIISYTLRHTELGQGDLSWELEFVDYEVLFPGLGSYVVLPFVVTDSFETPPREFFVEFDPVIEARPDKLNFLVVDSDWRSATLDNEAEYFLVFTAEEPRQVVSVDETSWGEAITSGIGLGIDHIEVGSDHILFMLALLLPTGLVFASAVGWRPTHNLSASLVRVVKIVASFTLGHAIALVLGGVGSFVISLDVAEPIVIGSIALAALHNLRPVFSNREWVFALVFGLFHGLGFAGLLADLGLDGGNRIFALLGFNIGVELGQIALIALIFPALHILRRTRVYLPLMTYASILVFVVAMGWVLDAVFGVDLNFDAAVELVLRGSRGLWIALIFTGFALVTYRLEKSGGRLLPVEPAADRRGSALTPAD